MKKIFFLFVSILSVSLITSCSSDDDKNTTPTVQGNWNFHSDFYSDSNNVIPSDSDWYIFDNGCATKKDYVEFRTSGVSKIFWYDDNCVESSIEETWSLNGNFLSWSSDGSDDEYEILELTNTTLKLKEIREYGTYYRILKK